MQIKNTHQQFHEHTGENEKINIDQLDYVIDDEVEFELTAEELQELEERSQRRINGESKTYTWEEVKDHILNEKKLS